MLTLTERVVFLKSPNVALYDEADWSGLMRREKNCTAERAEQIAQENPLIDYFFICRGPMVLPKHGQFATGDAVFFAGKPWYGSAPQCDSYVKTQFELHPDVAQYDGADWSKLLLREPDCTLEKALQIAAENPHVDYFFFCREGMVLPKHGTFKPGDAVFFAGEPWPGSAPQCDIYMKFRFEKRPNVAQYDEADWSTEKQRENHLTPEEAARIAANDYHIDFLFYCREPMYLTKHGRFVPEQAVFFAGKPWPGSAPQCDIYQKVRKSS